MLEKLLIIMHGVIYAIFAIALFFLPDLIWPFYGVEVNDQYARFLSQHNAIFLGGIAILVFLFRDIDVNGPIGQKFVTGLMWTNLLGVLITLYACFKGVFIGFGWSDPVFFSVLAFLCFLQLRKSGTPV